MKDSLGPEAAGFALVLAGGAEAMRHLHGAARLSAELAAASPAAQSTLSGWVEDHGRHAALERDLSAAPLTLARGEGRARPAWRGDRGTPRGRKHQRALAGHFSGFTVMFHELWYSRTKLAGVRNTASEMKILLGARAVVRSAAANVRGGGGRVRRAGRGRPRRGQSGALGRGARG
jgi:hypothetical protein